MTRYFKTILTLIGLFTSSSLYAPWVNGYYRRNGTYVQGYWRTEPNDYKWDNRNFNSWNSSYLTDWYNQSYFNDKAYYNLLKELDDLQKVLDKAVNDYISTLEKYKYKTEIKLPKLLKPSYETELLNNIENNYEIKSINCPKINLKTLKIRDDETFNSTLQSILTTIDYPVDKDGVVGDKTFAIIKQFQEERGLKSHGRLDELTTNALIESYLRSNKSSISVIDGDTFWWEGEKIRIYGYNAPELNESGGYLAKLRLVQILNSGNVSIEPVAKDKYGRIIAKVKINGVDINHYLN